MCQFACCRLYFWNVTTEINWRRLFSVYILSIRRLFNQHGAISSIKNSCAHCKFLYWRKVAALLLITELLHCSALNCPQNALWNRTYEAGNKWVRTMAKSSCGGVRTRWLMNKLPELPLQIVPVIILITRRNTLIFVHIYRREKGRRRERERENRERAFWLLKKPSQLIP